MKFVFDLDGTICFKGKPLSEKMVAALDTLLERGHELVFASARPIRDLLPVLPSHMHAFSLVGGNGAFVVSQGGEISTVHFESAIADEIVRLIEVYEAEHLTDSAWDYAYTGSHEHPIRRNIDPEQRARNVSLHELNEMVKVVILNSRNMSEMEVELQKLPVVIYRHGSEQIIDISPKGVDKWSGLQRLGMQPQQFIAFGNDANDIAMFRQAKHSVCVGEHLELKQLSSEQVVGDEDQVIRKIIEIVEGLK
ncbi:HAD-IIB family hydrolase [Paenibacillus sp. NPDC058174]|uniref:HAD-IIB family hydrolase n=1 Tax=Paenibacillus sp. NPDC058174 TaxID=3346366 RepID=UPI0036DD34A9